VLSKNKDSVTTTLSLAVQTSGETVSQTFSAQYDKVSDTWVANVRIQPGISTEFIVTWSEVVRDQEVKLAQATKTVDIPLGVMPLNLDISSDKYNHLFDADADGLSNLHETTNSTNPFDSSDPGISLAKVDVNVKLEIPGDLADIKNIAAVLPTDFLNGAELTLALNGNVNGNVNREVDRKNGEQKRPVSDAEFDKVLRNFDALSQAIENKDLRNIDKSISGTLQIDSLIRPNGDRESLSEKYASRTITSRRVNGDWSKIEW